MQGTMTHEFQKDLTFLHKNRNENSSSILEQAESLSLQHQIRVTLCSHTVYGKILVQSMGLITLEPIKWSGV